MKAARAQAPSARRPSRVTSTAELRAFQRTMLQALVQPLGPDDGPQDRGVDGRPMAEVAASFIKPNSRLDSLERLEIYHRMYWWRLIDCVVEDSPGLAALLGDDAFDRLVRAYLAKYPSRSFTLRNLCSRLPRFIAEEPRLTAPRSALALDVARFEWAQTVAYDAGERPLLGPAEIAGVPPARLRLALQPHLSLLALGHPADEFVHSVRRRSALRGEASNAPEAPGRGRRRTPRPRAPGRKRVHVAVFRVKGRLRHLRLEPAAFRILEAIGAGLPLERAIAAGGRVKARQIEDWFANWMRLGWFCSTII
jgi:hypothetical protein